MKMIFVVCDITIKHFFTSHSYLQCTQHTRAVEVNHNLHISSNE